MSQNSSRKKAILIGIGLPLWILGAFIGTQLLVGVVLGILEATGLSFENVNEAVVSFTLAAVVYTLSTVIVIGLPWLLLRKKTTREELGLKLPLRWSHIGIAPVGYIAYMLLAFILFTIAETLLTFIDFDQVQDVGFDGITVQYEYILAFITLVVLAPLAEEILFRGYLFSKLRAYMPLWIAILITSVLFGLVHFAWNVGIDTFALSIILCLLVVWTKSLYPAILLHMIKNFIAFLILFINPSLLTTLGG